MKTNASARRILKLRHVASLAAMLLLVGAEFYLVCRLGHECGQRNSQPAVHVPAMGDWFVSR